VIENEKKWIQNLTQKSIETYVLGDYNLLTISNSKMISSNSKISI